MKNGQKVHKTKIYTTAEKTGFCAFVDAEFIVFATMVQQ